MSGSLTLGELLGETPMTLDEEAPLINHRSTILAVTITFIILSWICVLLRLYTRLIVIRSAGWDDCFVGLYLLTTTSGTLAVIVGTNYGMGQHFLFLTLEEASSYLTCFYVMNASYTASTAFIKLSLLFQYLRIFEKGTALRKLCVGLIVFVSLWGVAYTFMAWFPCFPIHETWALPRSPDARCYAFGSNDAAPFVGTFESHAGVNMILDIILLIIPAVLLFSNRTLQKNRLSLMGLLFMGSIVIMLSIWRLITVVQHRAATFPDQDPTWFAPVSIVIAALEIDFASMCASVPVFWPVLEKQFGRIFITQEVVVTREARWPAMYGDDRSELTRTTEYSRDASELELSKSRNSPTSPTSPASVASPTGKSEEEGYPMSRWDPITRVVNIDAKANPVNPPRW